MSGNFTQRGEFAVYDKWQRAQDAVNGGVDLVIELPSVYASGNAGEFARGAVKTLEAMKVLDGLIFGSETGSVDSLKDFVDFQREHKRQIASLMKQYSSEGFSYPAARQKALVELGFHGDMEGLSGSNNILAAEYIGNLENMKPIAIKRQGESYMESATSIRERLNMENPKRFQAMEKRYFDLIRSAIICSSKEQLEGLAASGEGLSNRLKNQVRYAKTREQLIQQVKSKRYTYTRIGRLLCQTILEIEKDDCYRDLFYIRPLAMNRTGAALLKRSRKTAEDTIFVDSIPKAIKAHPEIEKMLTKDVRATDLYNIIRDADLYEQSDYVRKPVIVI